MSDILTRLAALEAAVFGANVPAAVPAGEPTEEQAASVYAALRGLGFGARAQDVSSGNVINMLRATGGDVAKAAGSFAADALRFRSRAEANLSARGVKHPTEEDILDTCGYLLWVQMHDQGSNALAMAQGFPDSLGEL